MDTAAFRRSVREQLFKTNFTGVTGEFTISQCAGVDYSSNGLGVVAGAKCGDRVQQHRELLNWNGNSWLTVSDLMLHMYSTVSVFSDV